MIDPFQVATNGLGPGFTTFNIALMGFSFIEITISDQPGARGPVFSIPFRKSEQEDDKYVTIKIRLKDNEFIRNYRISSGQAVVTIKLFENIKNFTTKTTILVNNFVLKPLKKAFKINFKDLTNK